MKQDAALLQYNFLSFPSQARWLIEVQDNRELASVPLLVQNLSLPWMVLGGGSNVVLRDAFPGVVILMRTQGIEISETDQSFSVTVKAGENWSELVEKLIARGVGGLEYLSAIPGTVGAAPIQNIGAYGSEVQEFIEQVTAFDMDNGEMQTFSNADCKFGYRDSFFKTAEGRRYIITDVVFRLPKKQSKPVQNREIQSELERLFGPKPTPTAAEISQAVTSVRARKLPDPEGNSRTLQFL